MSTEKTQRNIAMILYNGSYSSLHQAMSIVQASVANDMSVHLFFTYDALEKLVRQGMDEIRVDVSEGSTEAMLKEAVGRGETKVPSKMLEDARVSGLVHIYACSQSMGILGVGEEEVLHRVDKIMGYVSFLALAEGADIVLRI